jgi:hypothetical protein
MFRQRPVCFINRFLFSQYSSPRDYIDVFSFLSTGGPMMDLIYKLLPGQSFGMVSLQSVFNASPPMFFP